MPKTIEHARPGITEDETLLHADGQMVEIAERAHDFIAAEFRRINPDKPEDDRLLCGGCVGTILLNMVFEGLRRGEVGDEQGAAYLEGFAFELSQRAAMARRSQRRKSGGAGITLDELLAGLTDTDLKVG